MLKYLKNPLLIPSLEIPYQFGMRPIHFWRRQYPSLPSHQYGAITILSLEEMIWGLKTGR